MATTAITVLSGDEIAQLRIAIFKEYPYLYEGDPAYEAGYLKKFAHTPDSLVAVATEGGRVVGAMTGLPLACEEQSIKSPLDLPGRGRRKRLLFQRASRLPYRLAGDG